MPLVSGFALRTRLIPVLPLVFVARPANRESTDITGHETVAVNSLADIVAADLANLPADARHRLPLQQTKFPKLENQVESIVSKIRNQIRSLSSNQIHSNHYLNLLISPIHK